MQFDGASVADNVIAGNYIGTDITGTVAIPNRDGVELLAGSTANTVGGTSAGAGNLIAGNTEEGLGISAATNNVVVGNMIGLNASGTVALGNGWFGVAIYGPATGNIIGGTIAAARNVISGNALGGVHITMAGATGNTVEGNYIGTDIHGTVAIANGSVGVEIDTGASGNTIGGTAAGAGSLISGNTGDGVEITGAGTSGNLVTGNLIGTDQTGTLAISNTFGIDILNAGGGNTIGGATAEPGTGAGNLIAFSDKSGIAIFGDAGGDVILGNAVTNNGTNSSNAFSGVTSASRPTSRSAGRSRRTANLISGNGFGIDIEDSSGDLVQGNLIGTNAGRHRRICQRIRRRLYPYASTDNTIGGTATGAGNSSRATKTSA